MRNLIVLAILATLAWVGYSKFQAGQLSAAPSSEPEIATPPMASFNCDGRTHCSQMTSCAEAKYFLAHCPGTQMDGNNDGEPCEQQWCTN